MLSAVRNGAAVDLLSRTPFEVRLTLTFTGWVSADQEGRVLIGS